MMLTASLNPQQTEAVTHVQGPLLVLAGAGSGKTHVLTQRIAHLLKNGHASPHEIVAVTFTNKAAQEMKERIAAEVGEKAAKELWVGTFHALSGRILRVHADKIGYGTNFTVYDDQEQLAMVSECLKQMELDPERYPPRQLLAQIGRAKSQGLGVSEVQERAKSYPEQQAAEVFRQYQAKLQARNAVDFDDLLLLTLRLWREHPDLLAHFQARFRFVHVDEYQDTNITQYLWVQALARHGNLLVVGDVDQSIYSFRHADFRIILRFRDDYPDARIVTLEENYRSHQRILEVANAVIAHNTQRYPKVLRSTLPLGEKVKVFQAATELEEAAYVVHQIQRLVMEKGCPLGAFAVLYRTNAQSRALEEAFVRAGMPHQLLGGTRFYDRREIKDLVAYLRVLYNPLDSSSLKRILNVPRRGIGKTAIERMEATGLPLWDVVTGLPPEGITPKSRQAIARFGDWMKRLHGETDRIPVSRLIEELLDKSGYQASLMEEGTPEAEDRLDNCRELISAAQQFESFSDDTGLGAFLMQIALVADVDGWNPGEAVVLMTLHGAKGLEFPMVFLVGLEEGIFPHQRAIADDDQLEEERRLMYVGVTRARERLFLSWARQRTLYGRTQWSMASRFLDEAPAEHLERPGGGEESAPLQSRFGGAAGGPQGGQPAPWKVGDRVVHRSWGEGIVTRLLGSGAKMFLAVHFPDLGQKVLDPRIAPLEKCEA